MPKRSSRPTDAIQLDKLAKGLITGAVELPKTHDGKDPVAVALGRRGGLKGGRARAESLSQKRRKEIAKKAAAARWQKPKERS